MSIAESNIILVKQSGMRPTFRQSHEFIFQSQNFSATEEVIISLLCSRENVVNPAKTLELEDVVINEPKAYLFDIDVLTSAFKTDSKNLYGILKPVTEKLMRTRSVESPEDSFEYENLFQRCVFNTDGLLLLPTQSFYDRLFLTHNGFAEIDQHAFLSIKKNKTAMRLFRILSRFKGKTRLYPIEIKKLKTLFGVYDENGAVLLKSYTSTTVFLKKVIEPALQVLAESSVCSQKIKFLKDTECQDSPLGMRRIFKRNKVVAIEFLYEWFEDNHLIEHSYNYNKKEAYIRIEALSKAKHSRALTLEELRELKYCFGVHDKQSYVDKTQLEIDALMIEKEKQQEEEFNFDFLQDGA